MTTSTAQKKASAKYHKEKLKRVPLDLKHDDYNRIKQAATAVGESVNGFIKKSVALRINSIESGSSYEEQ